MFKIWRFQTKSPFWKCQLLQPYLVSDKSTPPALSSDKSACACMRSNTVNFYTDQYGNNGLGPIVKENIKSWAKKKNSRCKVWNQVGFKEIVNGNSWEAECDNDCRWCNDVNRFRTTKSDVKFFLNSVKVIRTVDSCKMIINLSIKVITKISIICFAERYFTFCENNCPAM